MTNNAEKLIKAFPIFLLIALLIVGWFLLGMDGEAFCGIIFLMWANNISRDLGKGQIK